MTARDLLVVLVAELLANELLGINRWLAYRIAGWAARRWRARSGVDHGDEWRADLDELPTDFFRLGVALWLALGAVVPPGQLTLNLPTASRVLGPVLCGAWDGLRAAFVLVRRLLARRPVRRGPRIPWQVRLAVALLPSRYRTDQLAAGIAADLDSLPAGRRNAFLWWLLVSSTVAAIRLRVAGPR